MIPKTKLLAQNAKCLPVQSKNVVIQENKCKLG